MAENKMKEVAELLGVKFEQHFNIKYVVGNPYIIRSDGLFNIANNKKPLILMNLLLGYDEIELSILNEKEKKYLESVLRPFKDKVIFIRKELQFPTDKEYIHIEIKNDLDIDFPDFKLNTMYKGMEVDKEYTTEELGLFDDRNDEKC